MGKVPSAKGTVGKPTEFKGVASEKEDETRIIVLAQGIEAHDEDRSKPPLDYLHEKFRGKFKIEKDPTEIKKKLSENKIDGFKSVRRIGLYTNKKQKVQFIVVQILSKRDFKLALETEEPPLHVIYLGHSRYGRGACFDTYAGLAEQKGNQWEDGVKGREEDSGLFRLGYPYVPVSLGDIAHHNYNFTPCPVEDGPPPEEKSHPFSRHPSARNAKLEEIELKKVKLHKKSSPMDLEFNTRLLSRIGKYYGLTIKGERHLLLRAGWEPSKKFDVMDPCLFAPNLGKTDLKCRVFCHFGCSSRVHFWDIVRRKEYKGWERPKPPTDKYAYFTNHPSDTNVTRLWLYHLLAYEKENKNKPWWGSLEEAKRRTNRKLSTMGEPPKMIY